MNQQSEENQGKILADLPLPAGKAFMQHEGQTVLVSTMSDGSQTMISKGHFQHYFPASDFPPLVRLVARGSKSNLIFMYLWIDPDAALIKWKIGELTDSSTFEKITWKDYDQIPGVKNKGLGNQGDVYKQAWFEASRKWVAFLEKSKYKLLFPQDEVVGNQIYFMRSTEPELLTSKFVIPDAMLAEKYTESRLKPGPVIIQPKYDGKRNIVGLQEGRIINCSRGRKQDKSNYPTIKEQAMVVYQVINERLGQPGNLSMSPVWLDGEIYKHGVSFQKLMSATQASVNQHQNAKNLDYVVYDLIDDGEATQIIRLQFLELVFNDPRVKALPNIKLSPWKIVYDHSTLAAEQTSFESMGFEGAMVRDPNAKYIQKRTWSIMKMKKFITEEWFIVGAEQATGLQEGCVIWILNSQRDGSGLTCRGIPAYGEIGNHESRKQQYLNRHMFMGVCATIKYFEKSDIGKFRFANVIAYNRTDM